MYKFLHKQVLMQESLRDSLLFLVNINDLADDLTSNAKSFADDTSLFYFQINRWTFTWKMVFNSDPSNQSHEIIFNRKNKEIYHPLLRFKNSIVSQTPNQKHLGIFLDAIFLMLDTTNF